MKKLYSEIDKLNTSCHDDVLFQELIKEIKRQHNKCPSNTDDRYFFQQFKENIAKKSNKDATKIIIYCLYLRSRPGIFCDFFNQFLDKFDYTCRLSDVDKKISTGSLNILGFGLHLNMQYDYIEKMIINSPSEYINQIIYISKEGDGMNAYEFALRYYKLNPDNAVNIINTFCKKGATTERFLYFLLRNIYLSIDTVKYLFQLGYISYQHMIYIDEFTFNFLGYSYYLEHKLSKRPVKKIPALKERFQWFLSIASPEILSQVIKEGPIQDKSLRGMANHYGDKDVIQLLDNPTSLTQPMLDLGNHFQQSQLPPNLIRPISSVRSSEENWDMIEANHDQAIPLFNGEELALLLTILESDEDMEKSNLCMSSSSRKLKRDDDEDLVISQPNPLTSSSLKNKNPTMFINQKYLDFSYPDKPQISPVNVHDNNSIHAFEHDDVTTLKFVKVSHFKIDGRDDIRLENERLNYIRAKAKQDISKTDKVFVVFAGRGLKASLPSELINTRCLVVLTSQEFETYQIAQRTKLRENYDFLIITRPRLKIDGTWAKHSTLIERRRAALDFCNEKRLSQVIFMDDNVEHIGFVAPLGYEKTFTGLFDYAINQMNAEKNMFVSIHTYSHLRRVPLPRMLGSKVWALHLEKIRTYLPGDAMQLCLPDREDAWGEDYYLQLLVDVLTSESDGFSILDAAVVELTRCKQDTNSCAKSGVRAKKLIINDIIPNNMLVSLSIKAKIEEAIQRFNQLLMAQISYHRKMAEAVREDDFEAKRVTQYKPLLRHKYLKHDTYNTELFFTQKRINPRNLVLKQYQTEAINFYLDAKDKKSITFDMPTGSGKTLIMLMIAFANFAAHKKNIIIIYPRIELIKQLLNEIQYSRYNNLLDYFQIDFKHIFGVSSADILNLNYAMLKQDQVAYNKGMNEKPHILIFCEDSWNIFFKNSPESKILQNIQLIIFDESHLQTKTISATKDRFKDMPIHYYSATPHTPIDDTFFSLSRDKAIHEGHLAPIYVDSTLPNQFDAQTLLTIMLGQQHPNDGGLSEHKGIIFVDTIENAQSLAIKFRETFGAEHVFEVHSKCSDYSGNIQQFREKKDSAVAIAVDMLQEGYNDEFLDFIIYAKTSQVTNSLKQNLIQAAGRIHRLCAERPHKIGFLIVNFDYIGIVTTCLPGMMKMIPTAQQVLGLNLIAKSDGKRAFEDGPCLVSQIGLFAKDGLFCLSNMSDLYQIDGSFPEISLNARNRANANQRSIFNP